MMMIDAVVMMSGGRSPPRRPSAAQPIVMGQRSRQAMVMMSTASRVEIDLSSCRTAGRRRLHSGGGMTMMVDVTEMMIIMRSSLARLAFANDAIGLPQIKAPALAAAAGAGERAADIKLNITGAGTRFISMIAVIAAGRLLANHAAADRPR